jgi:hypothetical protein
MPSSAAFPTGSPQVRQVVELASFVVPQWVQGVAPSGAPQALQYFASAGLSWWQNPHVRGGAAAGSRACASLGFLSGDAMADAVCCGFLSGGGGSRPRAVGNCPRSDAGNC